MTMIARELADGYDGCLSAELHARQLPHPHIVAHGIYFDERDASLPMSVAAFCSLHMTEDDKALATAEHTPDPKIGPEAWEREEARVAQSMMEVGYIAFLNHVHETHPEAEQYWPDVEQIKGWLGHG